MVGDRWRDIEAGQNAGCATVFIDYGYDEKRPERYDLRAGSLAEAADVLLSGGMYEAKRSGGNAVQVAPISAAQGASA